MLGRVCFVIKVLYYSLAATRRMGSSTSTDDASMEVVLARSFCTIWQFLFLPDIQGCNPTYPLALPPSTISRFHLLLHYG